MARINSLGVNPINAVAELFKADHILSSAPPRERAQRMAKLISDYGIDIAELDSALSGKAADPVETRVETLLKSRLEPFNAYLQQQQQREQQERQLQEQTVAETVNKMAQDAKYPYFERVRSTMADLIEFAAAKGQTLTIDSAYNRAVVLDPDINQEITAQRTSQNAAALLADSTAKAKRALNASVSVSGSPTGSATGSPSPADRRATIEAAFSAAEGR
jgi:DNA-binding ferritin-like protein